MRQIVLDTETTGLNPRTGDRIIEIGCVELVNRRLTGNNFHCYINPERDSEEGALAVHGLTTEFLSDKPKFAEIAQGFCDYVRGAEVVIHNAPFDVGFIEAEFKRLKLPVFVGQVSGVLDTLQHAKEIYPGKRNSLDALCDRYGISNAHRVLHGALLDAELLADVYIAMTRGQNSLTIDPEDDEEAQQQALSIPLAPIQVLAATQQERQLHEDILDQVDQASKGTCLWRTLEKEAGLEK